MAFRLRLGGHPVHPMLVHFPIALWTVAVALDAAGWISPSATFPVAAFGCLAAGVVLAAIAMLAGFLDFVAIPRGHEAQGVAVSHMLAMGTAWLLFLSSLALRGWPPAPSVSPWASGVAGVGFIALAAGGWLGGKLVYGFGIGVASRPK